MATIGTAINPRLPKGADASLYHPDVPEPNRYPWWLRFCVMFAIRNGRLDSKRDSNNLSCWEAIDHARRQLGDSWMDHVGRVVRRGRAILISEPYGFDGRQLRDLEKFCSTLELVFRIDARSSHFPGLTIRIEVEPSPNANWLRKRPGVSR